MQTTQMKSSFAGNAEALGAANGGRTTALFKKAAPKVAKPAVKKAEVPVKKSLFKFGKKVPPPSRKPGTQRSGSVIRGAHSSLILWEKNYFQLHHRSVLRCRHAWG